MRLSYLKVTSCIDYGVEREVLPVVSPDATFGDLLYPVGDQPDMRLVECLLENYFN